MEKDERKSLSAKVVIGRIMLYGIVGFAVAVSETTLFADIALFGAVPDVTLAFVIGVALFEGEVTGAILGVGAGFVIDALGSVGLSLSPLLFMLAGYFCGVFSKRILAKNYLSWLFYTTAAFLVHTLTTLIETAFAIENFTLLPVISSVLIPEFFCSLVFCSAVYPLAKLSAFISKKFFR